MIDMQWVLCELHFVKWQFNTHKDNICLQMRPSMKTTVWHTLVALSFSPSYIYVHICIWQISRKESTEGRYMKVILYHHFHGLELTVSIWYVLFVISSLVLFVPGKHLFLWLVHSIRRFNLDDTLFMIMIF